MSVRVVAVGGGSGLPVLLRGLKRYTTDITAVVTVCDDGGSSGRLRRDMGIVAPGDVRNCIIALADTEPLMEELFAFRFNRGELSGHNVGNLILAALTEMRGDFEGAIAELSQVLKVRGKVMPSTLESCTLCARLKDGRTVCGETLVGASEGIQRVFLDRPVQPPSEVVEAILTADAVVLGPGSLYTSVMPNLAVQGIASAMRNTRATRIYVCNIMTEYGETFGYSASQHAKAIIDHCGRVVDHVIVNTEEVPAHVRENYALERAAVVEPDVQELEGLGVRVWAEPLLEVTGEMARHNSDALARLVLRILNG